MSKSITNEQLLEQFPEQISSKIPFIFHLEPLQNGTMTLAYVAQNITSDMDAFATDRKPRVPRCTQLFATTKVQKLSLEVGSLLPGTNIQITNRSIPKYHGQKPKEFRNGKFAGQLMLCHGQPFYDHNSLVIGPAVHDEWTPDQYLNQETAPDVTQQVPAANDTEYKGNDSDYEAYTEEQY